MGKYWVTVNGVRKRTKAGVKHEYDRFQSSAKAIKERDERNAARRKLEKEGKVHKGDGKDVHHSDSDPNHGSRSNLRVESAHKNRGNSEDSRLKGSKRNKSKWGK